MPVPVLWRGERLRTNKAVLLTACVALQTDIELTVQIGYGVIQHLEQLDGEAGSSGLTARQ